MYVVLLVDVVVFLFGILMAAEQASLTATTRGSLLSSDIPCSKYSGSGWELIGRGGRDMEGGRAEGGPCLPYLTETTAAPMSARSTPAAASSAYPSVIMRGGKSKEPTMQRFAKLSLPPRARSTAALPSSGDEKDKLARTIQKL